MNKENIHFTKLFLQRNKDNTPSYLERKECEQQQKKHRYQKTEGGMDRRWPSYKKDGFLGGYPASNDETWLVSFILSHR